VTDPLASAAATTAAIRHFNHAVTHQGLRLLAEGVLKPLRADSQYAADRSYCATTMRLCEGLEKALNSYAESSEPHRKRDVCSVDDEVACLGR